MTDYAEMTVREMRAVLKEAGVPIHGLKSKLIERMAATFGPQEAEPEDTEAVEDVPEHDYEMPEMGSEEDGEHVIPKPLRDMTRGSSGPAPTAAAAADQLGQLVAFSHNTFIAPSLEKWAKAVTQEPNIKIRYTNDDLRTIHDAWEAAALEYGWTVPVPTWVILIAVEAAATVPIIMGVRQVALDRGTWKPPVQGGRIRATLSKLAFWRRTQQHVQGEVRGGVNMEEDED